MPNGASRYPHGTKNYRTTDVFLDGIRSPRSDVFHAVSWHLCSVFRHVQDSRINWCNGIQILCKDSSVCIDDLKYGVYSNVFWGHAHAVGNTTDSLTTFPSFNEFQDSVSIVSLPTVMVGLFLSKSWISGVVRVEGNLSFCRQVLQTKKASSTWRIEEGAPAHSLWYHFSQESQLMVSWEPGSDRLCLVLRHPSQWIGSTTVSNGFFLAIRIRVLLHCRNNSESRIPLG